MNNWATGVFGGAGAGVFVTNASNTGDLAGPFKVWSLNAAAGIKVFGIQVAAGSNTDGEPIWVVTWSGPVGLPFPTGFGYGIGLSTYNTNTVIVGSGSK